MTYDELRALLDEVGAENVELRNRLAEALNIICRQTVVMDQQLAYIEDYERRIAELTALIDGLDYAFEQAGELLRGSVESRINSN